MSSYKLNNSYTVYVNWTYYNEAKKKTEAIKGNNGHSVKSASKSKNVIIPIPVGTKISSKAFGNGTLKSKNSNGVISVQFDERIVRFLYPEAFKQGHLVKI